MTCKGPNKPLLLRETDRLNHSSSQVQVKGFCERSSQLTFRLNSQGRVVSLTTVMPLACTLRRCSLVTLTSARPRPSEFKLLPVNISFWNMMSKVARVEYRYRAILEMLFNA